MLKIPERLKMSLSEISDKFAAQEQTRTNKLRRLVTNFKAYNIFKIPIYSKKEIAGIEKKIDSAKAVLKKLNEAEKKDEEKIAKIEDRLEDYTASLCLESEKLGLKCDEFLGYLTHYEKTENTRQIKMLVDAHIFKTEHFSYDNRHKYMTEHVINWCPGGEVVKVTDKPLFSNVYTIKLWGII